jgi:purine-cytosine permease-like protein
MRAALPRASAPPKNERRMRWKLLLTASLLATIVGAGAPLGIVLGFSASPEQIIKPNLLILSTLIIPILAITSAAFFVYRHTAKRRQIQAMLTVLLSASLTLAILIFGSILLTKPAPSTEPAPQRNVG